ncbi:MAG: putative transcriptional regulator, Crp/Fnr family [Chitinophagaceae bacterium]|nr:putative transcriptional regulator, Crp/Fnr family [Chitinophagaceae bacterium]
MLQSFHPVPVDLQIFLLHHLPREVHRANKTILHEGEVCDWIAFVEKGLLKIYYELEDGSERVIWYHKDHDVIGSMKSYYTGLPSKLVIQTLEETHLRRIRKPQLNALYSKYPEFNINARFITEHYYGMCEDHAVLLAMPPRERFEKLQAEHPWMVKDPRIKDYMLADYLCIDKTTLSKYRKGGGEK